MLLYSLGLTLALVVSAPWWLLRMATTSRYREGLRQRLGGVPAGLISAVKGKQVVWIHAVSVGEVLAASRLVGELGAALGEGFLIVVSTTTRTGQALARQRFGAERVFYMPLDFAWVVRRYLRVLTPRVLVLMESELWPRLLYECGRTGLPVAVVNARVSDRSFARGTKMRVAWGRALRKVSLWLAQSDEDARRLVAMGAAVGSVRVGGNLKYDVRAAKASRVAEMIELAAAGRPIVVAGSTVDRLNKKNLSEDEIVIQAWQAAPRRDFSALLVIGPRHPERFREVEAVVMEFSYALASDWIAAKESTPPDWVAAVEIVLLDTIGDLAAVYGIADVAFVGGSLVKRGGHNPLEPAQFGVPVVMGPSYENFRDIVAKMKDAGGISILGEAAGLSAAAAKSTASGQDDRAGVVELEKELVRLLTDRDAARAMGKRGQRVFEEQQGATVRAVEAIVELVKQ